MTISVKGQRCLRPRKDLQFEFPLSIRRNDTIIEKFCNYCGKTYYVAKSQEKRSKFCSDICFRASRNTLEDYVCDYCGKTFKVKHRKIEEKNTGKRKHILCSSECAKNIQKPPYEEIKDLFEKRGYILISNNYQSAKSKLVYLCEKHLDKGEQSITYNNLTAGYGCKYCGTERTANSKRLSFNDVEKIFEKHDMILCQQEYINAATPLSYVCKNHPQYGVQYMALCNAYKNRCPYCNQSKGEARIADYLKKNNIIFESQKKYDSLISSKGSKLSYDFYINDFNVLIEYQGQYHDGTAGNQSEEGLIIQQAHDKQKREFAENNNIRLIEIWYYDFGNIEHILDNLFSKSENSNCIYP